MDSFNFNNNNTTNTTNSSTPHCTQIGKFANSFLAACNDQKVFMKQEKKCKLSNEEADLFIKSN